MCEDKVDEKYNDPAREPLRMTVLKLLVPVVWRKKNVAAAWGE